MEEWRKILTIPHGTKAMSCEIPIKRGIFQGYILISNELKSTNYGFDIRYNHTKFRLNHLIYMNDLKLYASTQQHLKNMIKDVHNMTSDIGMTFEASKCKHVTIEKVLLNQRQ